MWRNEPNEDISVLQPQGTEILHNRKMQCSMSCLCPSRPSVSHQGFSQDFEFLLSVRRCGKPGRWRAPSELLFLPGICPCRGAGHHRSINGHSRLWGGSSAHPKSHVSLFILRVKGCSAVSASARGWSGGCPVVPRSRTSSSRFSSVPRRRSFFPVPAGRGYP